MRGAYVHNPGITEETVREVTVGPGRRGTDIHYKEVVGVRDVRVHCYMGGNPEVLHNDHRNEIAELKKTWTQDIIITGEENRWNI